MSQPNAQQKTGEGRPGYSQNRQQNHSVSHNQAQADFIDAMAAAGVAPHDAGVIIADGELHRYRVAGDKPNTKNGYFTLHLDGVPAGHFGSWKHGIAQSWSDKSRNEMTPAQRDEQRRRINAARQAAVAELEQRHRDAAEKAAYLWSQATPAQHHPYLSRKAVQPFCARVLGDALVLPIVAPLGELTSLQFIDADGGKRLLSGGAKKGGCVIVQSGAPDARVLICEGFATGATLAMNAPSDTVLSAIDAGNLLHVALETRRQRPDADIVIAVDFDEVGRTKGIEAAQASRARILPVPDGLPANVTDWNDYATLVTEVQDEH